MANTQVQLGQKLQLTIKRLGINGEGIGYYKKLIIFVPRVLPGEQVIAEVTKASPRFAEAKMTKIVKPSSDRIQPPCKFYDRCGGCQLQHLVYDKQLDFKKDLLKQALEKFKPNGYQQFELRDTLAWMFLGITATKRNFNCVTTVKPNVSKQVYTKWNPIA